MSLAGTSEGRKEDEIDGAERGRRTRRKRRGLTHEP